MYRMGDTLFYSSKDDPKAVRAELAAHAAEKTRASREEALSLIAEVKSARADAEQAKEQQALRAKSIADFQPGPSPGVDALPFEGGGGSSSGTAADEIERRVGEHVEKGQSRRAALSAVFRDDPGLHRSYIEEHGRQ